jgi:hypothetical protein
MKDKELRDDILKKVLEYWFMLEFLAQDKYPVAGIDIRSTQNQVRELKKKALGGRTGKKVISNFVTLRENDNIYEVISSEAQACKMSSWGNLTFYIGTIKREACIESIAQKIQVKDDIERPEKSNDKIAWISLQLSPEGEYIEYSLSISTIMWAMNQVKNTTGGVVACLDEKQYRKEVTDLEKKFFGKKDSERQENVIPDNKESKTSNFGDGAVTLAVLNDLFEEFKKRYVNGNILSKEDESIEKIFGVSFQLFENEAVRADKEEENYQGLSYDFYSDDIKLLMNKVSHDSLMQEDVVKTDIVRYITALYHDNEDDRTDLVKPKMYDEDFFFEYISAILRVEHAPLGKWPSKFMPSFMQQIAINLGNSEVDEENIFSVNGPPGTGKTTLLKEIIVNNIVERAILLSKYDNPDEEAFIEHDFIHGKSVGKAYSKYTRHWYSLENDAINDYSILVASCNNAAVENISKELPMGSNIIKDLQADDSDSKEMKSTLLEVQQLFDVECSTVSEEYDRETYKDIYFTKYARELLGNKDAWGLIAAPMGKKSNISDFYRKVLSPFLWSFYPRKEVAQKRVEKFQEVKKLFLEQLAEVKKQQNELTHICQIAKERIGVIKEKRQILIKNSQRIVKDKNKIIELKQNISELKKDARQTTDVLIKEKEKERIVKDNLEQCSKEVDEKNIEIRVLMEKEHDTRKSTGWFTKKINRNKYDAAIKLADSYKEDIEKAKLDLSQRQMKATELEAKFKSVKLKVEALSTDNQEIKDEIRECEEEIQSRNESIAGFEQETQNIEMQYREIDNRYQEAITEISGKDSINSGVVIDEAFIERLLSKDIEKSTKAQVENPWFTQKYNREREKLFYYAMRLNKEFVLSSNHCRDNLRTLSQYWGLGLGDEKEKIIFHKQDRKAFVAALYQTLFLLVPVLSSTFASIGTFLKDVKKGGVIGTLIVDEAGQAQPQMVLGALYRSRTSIIVGDPKQVEPVVTDDLKLLKEVFDDEILKPYKNKTLSVQGFADELNQFGTYLDNGTDTPDWVGCPLLVHRRCISPMYDISNEISYNNMMKQQTRKPSSEVSKTFVYNKSQWINVAGKENGNKNHFVEEQGKKVCEMLEMAFEKSDYPNLYIISPFSSVVSGMRAYIKKFCKDKPNTPIKKGLADWLGKNIGTVHTFQGKEANEVIFLLGCDTSASAKGAVRWVNNNIVNVAATRAKFRLYIIGDARAWEGSICVSKAKAIIDTFAIKKIQAILGEEIAQEDKKDALAFYSEALPSATAFPMEKLVDEEGEVAYSIDTTSLLKGLGNDFIESEISKEQLNKFGFKDIKELSTLTDRVKTNLILGIKLFYLLQPVYEVNKNLDASCCAIMFCKSIELQMKECFANTLKVVVPNHKMRGNKTLKDAQDKELMLGTFEHIIRKNVTELESCMQRQGETKYNRDWWKRFGEKLKDCVGKRNKCCHSGMFSWEEQGQLLLDIFIDDSENDKTYRELTIGGLLFESAIGKNLC